MPIVHKDTFTVYFLNSDTEKQFAGKPEAMAAAMVYVGNSSYAKPFPNEDTYFYGPGDGTTSVIVRRDFEFVRSSEPRRTTS